MYRQKKTPKSKSYPSENPCARICCSTGNQKPRETSRAITCPLWLTEITPGRTSLARPSATLASLYHNQSLPPDPRFTSIAPPLKQSDGTLSTRSEPAPTIHIPKEKTSVLSMYGHQEFSIRRALACVTKFHAMPGHHFAPNFLNIPLTQSMR